MSLKDELDKRTQARLIQQAQAEKAAEARLNSIRQERLQAAREALASAGSAEQTLLRAGVIPLFRQVADIYGIKADTIKLMWEAQDSLCENLEQAQGILVDKEPLQTYQSPYGPIGEGSMGTPYYNLKAVVETERFSYGQVARHIRAYVDTSQPQTIQVIAGKEWGRGVVVRNWGGDGYLQNRVDIELNGADPSVGTRLLNIIADIIAEGKDECPWQSPPPADTTFG